MSIQIHCPHCGRRPIEEFSYGEIPPDSESSLDRAFLQDNTAGVVTERWFHGFGCRRWITIQRDTRDNTIP